jgi:hypothetical protein
MQLRSICIRLLLRATTSVLRAIASVLRVPVTRGSCTATSVTKWPAQTLPLGPEGSTLSTTDIASVNCYYGAPPNYYTGQQGVALVAYIGYVAYTESKVSVWLSSYSRGTVLVVITA